MKSRVGNVRFGAVGYGVYTVLLHDGRRLSADLVVGADEIDSTMGGCLVGHPDKPTPTDHLAYRFLLKTKDMIRDL